MADNKELLWCLQYKCKKQPDEVEYLDLVPGPSVHVIALIEFTSFKVTSGQINSVLNKNPDNTLV